MDAANEEVGIYTLLVMFCGCVWRVGRMCSVALQPTRTWTLVPNLWRRSALPSKTMWSTASRWGTTAADAHRACLLSCRPSTTSRQQPRLTLHRAPIAPVRVVVLVASALLENVLCFAKFHQTRRLQRPIGLFVWRYRHFGTCGGMCVTGTVFINNNYYNNK